MSWEDGSLARDTAFYMQQHCKCKTEQAQKVKIHSNYTGKKKNRVLHQV